jgi:hypothetical protein
MPLIPSKSAAAAAAIITRVQSLAGNYNAAATHLNTIVRELLALSDADLAAFCNEQGPVGLNELTSLHGAHGEMISSLSAEAAAMLAESGILWPASYVDTRSLAEKIAEQGRVITFVDGSFVVTSLAQPETQPES